ncbi:recombinase family protein [Nocardia grenadensis]|uniref:recombinase family protein n=1 Tax=Nocardia grenadensis TaxID=931537 RepID=UPI003D8EAA2C
MANLLLSVMGAFAEFERAPLLDRQREGIAAAKARGAYTGRAPAPTTEQIAQLRERAGAENRNRCWPPSSASRNYLRVEPSTP